MATGPKRSAALRVALALTLLAVCSTALTSTASAATFTVPSSVDATGKKDVTRQLNDFIAGVPDGSTVSFPANATYRIEGVFALVDRHDLLLEFNGSRLVAESDATTLTPHPLFERSWPRHRPHLYIRESSGISVQDVVVRGPNRYGGTSDEAWRPEFEAQHAIEISRSEDVDVTGCDLSNTYGDGIYIGGRSERVAVTECEIHHTGRQGISVTSARNVVIEQSYLHEIRRTAFDLEPVIDWPVENVRIQNNRVGEARLNFVSGHGRGSTFTGIEILDNFVSGEMQIHMKAPSGTRRGSVVIRGNESTEEFGSPQALFTVIRYDDVTVTDNTAVFDGRSGGVGVTALQTCNLEVSRNTFVNVETQQEVTYVAGCPRNETPPKPEPAPLEVRIGVAVSVERSDLR